MTAREIVNLIRAALALGDNAKLIAPFAAKLFGITVADWNALVAKVQLIGELALNFIEQFLPQEVSFGSSGDFACDNCPDGLDECIFTLRSMQSVCLAA